MKDAVTAAFGGLAEAFGKSAQSAQALTDRMAEMTSGFLAGVSEAERPRDHKP